MNDCDKARGLLAIPAEERTPEESGWLREHLARCDACRREAEVFDRLDQVVAASLAAEPVPAAPLGRFLPPAARPAREPAQDSRILHLTSLARWAVAASVLFAIGAGFLGFQFGQARTEAAMLRAQLAEASARTARLEEEAAAQMRLIADLRVRTEQAPVRQVQYMLLDPRETVSPAAAQAWPALPKTRTRWQGADNENGL